MAMAFNSRKVLEELLSRRDLTVDEAYQLALAMLKGFMEEPLIAAFLVALRAKGEAASEIAGFAGALRETCLKVTYMEAPLLDTAGTGGDGFGTLNASTAAAIVARASGAVVAKHGNTSVSGRSGSADVMRVMGYRVDHGPLEALCILKRVGFVFLFAPNYHPAIRAVMPVRKKLGIRTIFNLVGPLANPANANFQVLGVPSPSLLKVIAEAAVELGYERLLVVHGDPGIDEVSVSGPTTIIEVNRGSLDSYSVTPEELGLSNHKLSSLIVNSPSESASRILEVLRGRGRTGDRDFIAANAGAAIYAYGLARDLRDGVEEAVRVIEDGEAASALEEIVTASSICVKGGSGV